MKKYNGINHSLIEISIDNFLKYGMLCFFFFSLTRTLVEYTVL